MATIRIITFDLDNTLWDVDSVIHAAESEMRAWLDVHVPEFSARMDRETMLELRSQVVAAEPGLVHDLSALRERVLFEAISACGYATRSAQRHASAAFQVFFEARQRVVFFDGALDALERLSGDYRLGALTNGNADIEKVGLKAYLKFAFSAADVGMSKPGPNMFNAAMNHCGAVAHECIHIGDNLLDDIHGAASIGMHTIWTNHGAADGAVVAEASSSPTRIVTHLAELPAAVREIHDA